MVLDEIRRRYNAKPFRPFVIVLKSGRRFVVPTRFQVAFPPGGKFVFINAEPSNADLYAIEGIARVAEIPRKRGGGSGEKRKAA